MVGWLYVIWQWMGFTESSSALSWGADRTNEGKRGSFVYKHVICNEILIPETLYIKKITTQNIPSIVC